MGISFNEEVDTIAKAAVDVSAPIFPNFMRYNVKRERSYFFKVNHSHPAKAWFWKHKFGSYSIKLLNMLSISHTCNKVYLN